MKFKKQDPKVNLMLLTLNFKSINRVRSFNRIKPKDFHHAEIGNAPGQGTILKKFDDR